MRKRGNRFLDVFFNLFLDVLWDIWTSEPRGTRTESSGGSRGGLRGIQPP